MTALELCLVFRVLIHTDMLFFVWEILQEVWLDRVTGRICMSISAKGMLITGIEDRRYWNWVPTEESRLVFPNHLNMMPRVLFELMFICNLYQDMLSMLVYFSVMVTKFSVLSNGFKMKYFSVMP